MKAVVCDFCGKYAHRLEAFRVKIDYFDMDKHRAVDIEDLCSGCFEELVAFCMKRQSAPLT